jgi:uncharacterized protein YutE (UPF0331/DUF86 family)
MNDVVISKVQSIQRCIQRAREEYQADPTTFATNYTRQDAAILNIVRACETAINLANHIIRMRKLGIPAVSADSFELLKAAGIIDDALADRMKKMFAFRNAVVHQYTEIDLAIVEAAIVRDLDGLLTFADKIRESANEFSS